MPSYTLYYFNGRGRAEMLRMMFAVANVKYMDKRFEFSEWDKYRNEVANVKYMGERFEFTEWAEDRNDMPGMCVPVLEMDGGVKMPETMAIARYLAREFGFYGKNNMDMFKIDYICDCFYEIMHDYMRFFHDKNGRFKTKNGGNNGSDNGDMNNSEKYLQWRYMNTCNRIMPFLERTLSKCNGGNQFFMGDQMMWCDMMCYCCLETPYMENQAMFSNYPKLISLFKRVAAHPKISPYLKSRCSTIW